MCLDDMQDYIDSRPPHVKKLMEEFPPGAAFEINNEIVYVVGIMEHRGEDRTKDMVVASPISPIVDYEASIASKRRYHLHCFREAAKRHYDG